MNYKPYIIIGLSLLCGLATSCQQARTLDPTELKKYIEDQDNGVLQANFQSEISITLEYWPWELIVYSSRMKQEDPSQTLEKYREAYAGMEYYRLKVSSSKPIIEKIGEFIPEISHEELMQYLNFSLQQDLYQIIDGDSIPCNYMHREISESITNTLDYTLGFQRSVSNENRRIVINSKLIKQLNTEFNILIQDIEKIPEIR